MAVTAKLYGLATKSAWSKKIDFVNDTIKVSLHTSTYTPNQDTHQFQSDLSNEVANGNGYTTGGATIATPSLTYTGATNVLMLDGGDVSWSASTITARYAVVYDSTPGTAATNPLIAYVDFGQDFASNNGTFTIAWDAAGIATVTVS